MTLPLPLKSPAPSHKTSIVLPPPPSKHVKQSAENGTLSIVIPPEVVSRVEESIVRLNGEASKGLMVVDEGDLQQWDKVVCCITVTADVYQSNIDGGVPKDARLVVSAKPQHDSAAESESLLKTAEDSASMLNGPTETVECDECGNRYFAYGECPCLSGDWPLGGQHVETMSGPSWQGDTGQHCMGLLVGTAGIQWTETHGWRTNWWMWGRDRCGH